MTTAPSSAPPAVRWEGAGALRGLLLALPAAAVAVHDVQLAALLAVGVIPAGILPLAPRRRGRLRAAVVGYLAGASIVLGSALAVWPPLAVAGLFVVAVLAGRVAADQPAGALVLSLCLPLMGAGLSYPGVRSSWDLGLTLVLGSTWALLVATCWPERPPASAAAAPPAPTRAVMARFGLLAGTTGAVCAAIGFGLDLEHVGWPVIAGLIVMRPVPDVQRMRSVDRIADVVVGALLAIGLVATDAPAWVFGAAIALVVVAATATAASRWYLTPAYTTFLVFVLLLATDPEDARSRFWERVLETALGIGVAALVALVLAPLVVRLRRPRT
ncbi:FUSC family protein [Nocardioides conyzicola]|uniref:Integral membrane bound transporter domain-containing protein n=1 Tax=Nocardioides conyzicola TaxID=1651781 RepID=A0ABP8WYI1_9ACTN